MPRGKGPTKPAEQEIRHGKPPAPKPAGVHLYRIKRSSVWGPKMYDPDGEDGPVVTIDTERQGIPPHHFEPLDGGPVQKTPKRSIFYEEALDGDDAPPPEPPAARKNEPEVQTLSTFANQERGKPLGT